MGLCLVLFSEVSRQDCGVRWQVGDGRFVITACFCELSFFAQNIHSVSYHFVKVVQKRGIIVFGYVRTRTLLSSADTENVLRFNLRPVIGRACTWLTPVQYRFVAFFHPFLSRLARSSRTALRFSRIWLPCTPYRRHRCHFTS
jgi:hypothetical protein